MARSKRPAAETPPADQTETVAPAGADSPEAAAPVDVGAGYETKVVTPAPVGVRNRILDQRGNVVTPPVGHVHEWRRGRRADGGQMYRCAGCGVEMDR